jgi:hypothetical protein
MKVFPLAVAATLALAASAFAGGIQGRVTNENGTPRRGVTISVKSYHQSTTTDANGNYVLLLPPQASGMLVNVHVNGTLALSNCIVSKGKRLTTVMVTMVRH